MNEKKREREKEQEGNGEMRSRHQMNEPFNGRLSQSVCNNAARQTNSFGEIYLFSSHKLNVIYSDAFYTPTPTVMI